MQRQPDSVTVDNDRLWSQRQQVVTKFDGICARKSLPVCRKYLSNFKWRFVDVSLEPRCQQRAMRRVDSRSSYRKNVFVRLVRHPAGRVMNYRIRRLHVFRGAGCQEQCGENHPSHRTRPIRNITPPFTGPRRTTLNS